MNATEAVKVSREALQQLVSACDENRCGLKIADDALSATESIEQDEPVNCDLRLNAYYYGFDQTGVPAIDLILSAVACAGKAFHHTEDWREDAGMCYGSLTGNTPESWIQNAANDAAKLYFASPQPAKPDALVPEWVSVDDRLPEGNVMATYLNSCGKRRTVIAFYAKQYEIESGSDDDWFEYSEDKDEFYLKEGWYERIQNWEDFGSVTINDPVTHWMPLPAAPSTDKP